MRPAFQGQGYDSILILALKDLAVQKKGSHLDRLPRRLYLIFPARISVDEAGVDPGCPYGFGNDRRVNDEESIHIRQAELQDLDAIKRIDL